MLAVAFAALFFLGLIWLTIRDPGDGPGPGDSM